MSAARAGSATSASSAAETSAAPNVRNSARRVPDADRHASTHARIAFVIASSLIA
jgi:hypothetical protein